MFPGGVLIKQKKPKKFDLSIDSRIENDESPSPNFANKPTRLLG